MWRLLLGTKGVKSLVQGLNAAATAGFEPRTVWSEVRRRNRLATAPPRIGTTTHHIPAKFAELPHTFEWANQTKAILRLQNVGACRRQFKHTSTCVCNFRTHHTWCVVSLHFENWPITIKEGPLWFEFLVIFDFLHHGLEEVERHLLWKFR